MENKVQLKDEAAGGDKDEDAIGKEEVKVDEKKEGSDEEDMEEERSWRRGYDAE